MRAAALIVSSLLLAGTVQAQNADHHSGGRIVISTDVLYGYDQDDQGHTLLLEHSEHQWPGAYFEIGFKGRQLNLNFADNHNRFQLIIDKEPPVLIDCGIVSCKEPKIIKVKKGGWHTARLETLTESVNEPHAFDGFSTSDGKIELVVPRARQIDIIGDSYAAGYGTTSTKRECTQEEIRLTTDTQQAFGALLGKHYDADYQINAVSGIGMVRNYGGGTDNVMPDLYPYTLFDKSVAYDDPSWQPQVVVIALGDNDFATPLASGEKWSSAEALRDDFISSYVTFVQSVRAKNPRATFVLMDFNEEALPGYLVDIADRLKAAGETRVLLYHPGGGAFEQTGCDWHLSLNDHQRLASGLEALIDSHPDIWSKNEQGQ